MRINISIDGNLMKSAMKAGNFKAKADAVEEGLRLLVRRSACQNLRALRGTLHWSLDGNWTNGQKQTRHAELPRPSGSAR